MSWGMKNIVITLFGSSIMEGRIGVDNPNDRWYNILQRLLSEAYPDSCFPIINSAVGGESTREIMRRFDQDILPYNPDICLFMVGGNNHDCVNPERILVKGELQNLMQDFAARLPAKSKVVGLVINPVVDEWHFASNHPAYKEYLAAFNGSLDKSLEPDREIARAFFTKQSWPCLDLHALMADEPQKYVLPQDGIHLNQVGQQFFAQESFRVIKKML